MEKQIYSSREEFESRNPYVLVNLETVDGRMIVAIVKSFTNKKTAFRYLEKFGNGKQEIMTRKQFMREALFAS